MTLASDMNLPSGTITFLFADVEGSTRQWESHPDEMREALVRYDEIAAALVMEFRGFIVKSRGEGDSIFAVFPLASEAVAAALALQVAFQREPWPGGLNFRVRLALHSGEAGLRDNDYYGPAVNRCARLRDIAHGGQILLSGSTQELARDALPLQASLRDYGDRRLKDLGRAESVHQLLHPLLPSEFPPLRCLDNPDLPNNLPLQMTSFVGRMAELNEVERLLAKTRLLTLTGAGGCGKTRIALQIAAEVLDAFRDGVWLIEFAAVSDKGLAAQTVASQLGLKEEIGKTVINSVLDHLKSKQLLLLLDNCEHLLADCANLADAILRHCPGVVILASSRESLGIDGELRYRVPSLALPDPLQILTPESLIKCESVALFLERARFHQPQFAVTPENFAALVSVCRRLDGIPLAIELAAARVRSLSVEEVDHRLDERFRLLTGGSRTAMPRQQTLRSLIDWSYDLLDGPEKALLKRLSIFAGGWNFDAAESVCAGAVVEEWQILDLLTSLTDKSLVIADSKNGVTRFRYLESVRQYAHDRLLEDGDGGELGSRHVSYFVGLSEEAELHLRGIDQQAWIDRLELELDNIRSALARSACTTGDGESALRICAALYRFWYVRGYLGEGSQWCKLALDHVGPYKGTAAHAKCLNGAGVLAFAQGEYVIARDLHELSLAVRRELNDLPGVAGSLNNLAMLAASVGDYILAKSQFEDSLAIWSELGDQWGIANAFNNLGLVAMSQEDFATARKMQEESLAIWRKTGDNWAVASSIENIATIALKDGDGRGSALLFTECLAIRRDLGDRSGIANALEGIADVAASCKKPLYAIKLWAAAEALRVQIGAPLMPTELECQAAQIRMVKSETDDFSFDEAWLFGSSMGVEAAIEFALFCGSELSVNPIAASTVS